MPLLLLNSYLSAALPVMTGLSFSCSVRVLLRMLRVRSSPRELKASHCSSFVSTEPTVLLSWRASWARKRSSTGSTILSTWLDFSWFSSRL